MNRPNYQEKLPIGLDDVSLDFDIFTNIGGHNWSNFKYIFNETGANVVFRGRGSGFIEPQTGRESFEPLHLFIEHDRSQEALHEACRLAYDLIKTVKNDWHKLNQQPGSSSRGNPQNFYNTSQMSRDGCGSRGEDQNRGRYRDNREHGNRESARPDDYGFNRGGNSSRDEWSGWRDREETGGGDSRQYRNPSGFCKSPNRVSEKKCPDNVYHRSKSPNWDDFVKWTEREGCKREDDCWRKGKSSHPEGDRQRDRGSDRGPWNSGGHSSWDKGGSRDERGDIRSSEREGRMRYQDMDRWKDRCGEWPEKFLHPKEENRNYDDQFSIKQEDSKFPAKKLRYDSSQNQGNVSMSDKGRGPYIKTEDKPEKERALKDLFGGTTLSQMSLLTKSSLQLDGVNPMEMTQAELQNLNRGQLLEVSRQQQALLMKFSDNLPSQSPSNMIYSPLKCEIQANLQINSKSETNMAWHGSYDREIKSESQFRTNTSEIINPTSRSSRKRKRRRKAQKISLSPLNRQGNELKNSAERFNYSHGSRGEEKYSPHLHRDGERYSSRLRDGQERYSPQLEDDFRTSPDLSSRNNNQNWSGKINSLAVPPQVEDSDSFKYLKRLLRRRVAVIDRHYNKMGPQDEDEIRSLVGAAQSALPEGKRHQIDFVGLTFKDYIVVLMPYSLEGMNWLVDKTYLTTDSGEKRFILFPYEDIFNKVRLRTTIFFSILDGFVPKEHAILMELCHLNEGINPEMWSILKFNQESQGFFMMVAVDLMSYLAIRKMHWKLRFRESYIKLEPFSSETPVDFRFI